MNILYKDLLALTQYEGTPFYISEQEKNGHKLHVFSYRLASFSDFSRPFALETRGSMFIEKKNGFELISRPMNKFFNAYENPFTMFKDSEYPVSDIAFAMIKLDGSVINSYMIDSELYLKSHTSTKSEQAVIANEMIGNDSTLYDAALEAEIDDYTVSFEYTSPQNRIVVPYQDSRLTVLNLRHRKTGELLIGDKLKEVYPVLYDYSVFKNSENSIDPSFPMRETFSACVDAIRQMVGIEGFVVIFKDGTMCKVKTDWYCSLHFNKESITVPSRLFEVVLSDSTDDLRQLFSTDEYAINSINRMEETVFLCYNTLVSSTEKFVSENGHLERKAFALKAKEEVLNENGALGAVFTLYDGKEPDYKGILRKNMKNIIKDVEL